MYTIEELRELIPGDRDLAIIESVHPTLVVPMILKNHLNGILLLGERIKGRGNILLQPVYPAESQEGADKSPQSGPDGRKRQRKQCNRQFFSAHGCYISIPLSSKKTKLQCSLRASE